VISAVWVLLQYVLLRLTDRKDYRRKIMRNSIVDHDNLPQVVPPVNSTTNAPGIGIWKAGSPFEDRGYQYNLSRQELRESKLKFWCIQAGLELGTAFLKSLAQEKAAIQLSYETNIEAINRARKYVLRWHKELEVRSAVNKSRRRDKLSVSAKESYLRARVTCEKRGCYAEVYRENDDGDGNGLCYHHYMKSIGKDPRGVSAEDSL
jgi:hypothetical protein